MATDDPYIPDYKPETVDFERTIHAAAMLRLQVCVNTLQKASVLADTLIDLEEIAARHPDEPWDEILPRLEGLPALIIAALQISWGGSSDVPPEVQMSTIPDLADAKRLLEFPRNLKPE